MDDLLLELESELKSLRPQPTSAHLRDRISRDLSGPKHESASAALSRYTTATNLNSWKWFGWRSVGLAAALGLVASLVVLTPRHSTPPTSAVAPTQLAAGTADQGQPGVAARNGLYRPVAATNVLYDLKDEGPVIVDGDTLGRQLRYRYLDTYTWKSSRGNASLKWSVPRDEIRVLPASLN